MMSGCGRDAVGVCVRERVREREGARVAGESYDGEGGEKHPRGGTQAQRRTAEEEGVLRSSCVRACSPARAPVLPCERGAERAPRGRREDATGPTSRARGTPSHHAHRYARTWDSPSPWDSLPVHTLSPSHSNHTLTRAPCSPTSMESLRTLPERTSSRISTNRSPSLNTPCCTDEPAPDAEAPFRPNTLLHRDAIGPRGELAGEAKMVLVG